MVFYAPYYATRWHREAGQQAAQSTESILLKSSVVVKRAECGFALSCYSVNRCFKKDIDWMAAHVIWRLFNNIGAIPDLTIFFNWQWLSKVLLMQYNLNNQFYFIFLSLQLWVLVGFFFCVQLIILFLSLKHNQTVLHPRASHPERSHLMTSKQTPTPPSA